MNPNEASANKTLNITGNGTTIIPGKFVLIALIVGTKAGSGHTAVIYDSNATIGANPERRKATIDDVNTYGRIDLGFPVFDGIYIVSGGGTTSDSTLVYAETP